MNRKAFEDLFVLYGAPNSHTEILVDISQDVQIRNIHFIASMNISQFDTMTTAAARNFREQGFDFYFPEERGKTLKQEFGRWPDNKKRMLFSFFETGWSKLQISKSVSGKMKAYTKHEPILVQGKKVVMSTDGKIMNIISPKQDDVFAYWSDCVSPLHSINQTITLAHQGTEIKPELSVAILHSQRIHTAQNN